jgi:hypothetical protein
VPLTRHQNTGKEILKKMLWSFKERRWKGKEKSSFTIRTATEKQPQHFGWHQAALISLFRS